MARDKEVTPYRLPPTFNSEVILHSFGDFYEDDMFFSLKDYLNNFGVVSSFLKNYASLAKQKGLL